MKKVTIEFPSRFEDTPDTPAFIQLGRLCIGDAICRLVLGEDGKLRMICPQKTKPFIEFLPEIKDVLI